jgi:hypothetical protein
MTTAEILSEAARLVDGDRARVHGDRYANFNAIAALWTAYLGPRCKVPLTADEAAIMLALVKVARSQAGAWNPDDYVDACGYIAIAGELAAATEREAREV